MGDDQFEKRMALLKKSYERVPSSFDSEEVLRKIEGESKKKPIQKKHRKFKQKAITWVVGVASVFLMGVLSASYFLPDNGEQATENQEGIPETELLNLEKRYEEARETKREKLQLTEAQFSKIGFVELADKYWAHTAEQPYLSQENIEWELKYGVDELALPSEMVEALLESPLTEDENASIRFMEQYREKIENLTTFYNELFREKDDIEEPMIAAMEQQGIQFLDAGKKGVGEVGYVPQADDDKIKDALHENVQGYYDMLLEEPYLFGDMLTYSLADTTTYLKEMESVLIASEENSHLYLVMHGYYLTLFNHIVKGSMSTPIVDENGIVKKEYQQVWKQLAKGEDNLPTTNIMRPIVEQMEATGWKKSIWWDVFNYKDVKEMLLLAQEGMLPQQ